MITTNMKKEIHYWRVSSSDVKKTQKNYLTGLNNEFKSCRVIALKRNLLCVMLLTSANRLFFFRQIELNRLSGIDKI
jgi:hypothetical protein